MTHLEYVRELKKELLSLDGTRVGLGSAQGTGTQSARGDSAERIAAALRRRKIVRER